MMHAYEYFELEHIICIKVILPPIIKIVLKLKNAHCRANQTKKGLLCVRVMHMDTFDLDYAEVIWDHLGNFFQNWATA